MGTRKNRGNVGIGTTSPNQALHVSGGNINVSSGNVFVTGAIVANGTAISSPVTAYAVTLANVSNTTASTTFLSFTVPSMADGEIIEVWVAGLKKNNKGTSGTITIDVAYGAVNVTQRSALGWSNDSTEFKVIAQFLLMRVGADLWVNGKTGAANEPYPLLVLPGDSTQNALVVSAPTFTSSQTVALNLTLDAADLNFYFKPLVARAWKFGT